LASCSSGGPKRSAFLRAGGGARHAETASVIATTKVGSDPATIVPLKPGPPEPVGGGGATTPFDRHAAAVSLGNINVQSCKKPDGPTGTSHVKVTFSPDGSVFMVVVDNGIFSGTAVGDCVTDKFRSAHVPAFAGGQVSVGKNFTIN